MPAQPPTALLLHHLEKWYALHGRKLPWRGRTEPYAIWVSEVMLQQTQVGTVVAYFERFMRRFPNLQSLAKAPLEEVLSLWQGLGYYGRCRKLHAAAQQLFAQGQTQLPSSLEALSALPGFGPYTVGAVASIAFGLPTPAIDGNLLRVFARLCALELEKAPLLAQVQRLAEGLLHALPPGHPFGPGSINQALMDLGATVCKPHTPRCAECPWSFACLALSQNKVAQLPLRKPSKPKPILSWLLAYIEWNGQLLMAQHSPKGLFGGLWGLPGVAVERRLLGKEAACGSPLSQCLGGQLPMTLLSQTQRVLTHRRLQLFVYAIGLEKRGLGYPSKGLGLGLGLVLEQGKDLLNPSLWLGVPQEEKGEKAGEREKAEAGAEAGAGKKKGARGRAAEEKGLGAGQASSPRYACLRWVDREAALRLPSSAALRKALEAALEKAPQISAQRL
ncbi:MAG: A/G-specific adenine glycosylase [Cystobacterineae bacterium]|nr:A/G-specific adenine glycosylase [Cystobacterineae bacterium]